MQEKTIAAGRVDDDELVFIFRLFCAVRFGQDQENRFVLSFVHAGGGMLSPSNPPSTTAVVLPSSRTAPNC